MAPFDENLRRTFDSLADRLRDEFARELAAAVEALEADAQSDRVTAAERAAGEARAAAEREAAEARTALERAAADDRAALERAAVEARTALERDAAARLTAEVASAEERARAAGRTEGHAQGRGEGHDEGLNRGLDEGRARGRSEGHALGRAEGFAAGQTEGRREGRAEGRAAGLAEGRTEGRAEGWTEGREQGLAEGRDQGRLAGIAEGRAEGRREGREEGWASGHADGLAEGRAQGMAAGRSEGDAEHDQRLAEAFRQLDAAPSLSEILDALATCASREAPRMALLLVRGWELTGWRLAGFGSALDNMDAVTIHMVDAGLVADAVRSAMPVGDADDAVARSGPSFPGVTLGQEPLAVPVVVGGQVVAALYADCGSDGAVRSHPGWRAAIEAMTRHASRNLEAVTAFRTAQMVAGQLEAVRRL